MKAKSIIGNSVEEIGETLKNNMAGGFMPTLAIVFISIQQDRDAISKLLDANNISVYGATSNGEFIDEEPQAGKIVILLLDMNRENYFIRFADLNGVDDRKTAFDIAAEALEKYKQPAFIIMASNLQTDPEELLLGFSDAAGTSVNVFGGMAGDDMRLSDQFVFTNGRSGNRGLIVLVLNEDKVVVKGRATSGWNAVGTEKSVTKSSGNRIYTIDNIPALDICLKYGGLSKDNPNLTIELMTNFPLQLQRANGDPVMRPGYRINWDDHSLMTSGKVPQGAKVRFSLPPDFDVIDKVINACKDLKETEMPEADALLIFNCAGRLLSLGPLINKELEGLKNVWGVPMAGMFSNAELARATNGNLEMHNLTTCCVAIKERPHLSSPKEREM